MFDFTIPVLTPAPVRGTNGSAEAQGAGDIKINKTASFLFGERKNAKINQG